MTTLPVAEFKTRQAASEEAAARVGSALKSDIARSGRAAVMMSGGSTPVLMFEALSLRDLEWEKVTVGLIDERWVPPDHPDSNERLLRKHFLKNRAGAAGLLPMKTPHEDPWAAQADRNAAYAPHCREMSMAVLGMGADGHTASWFPGMAELAEIIAASNSGCVAGVNAPAATIPHRMTLTGPAIFRAQRALLLVFGEDKRQVLLGSEAADPLACPVRFAINALADRLSVLWAP